MDWRFARTPKWVVRHVLVAALVIVMIAAGFWQLRRLDDKRDARDLIRARQDAPVAEATEVIPIGASVDAADVDAVLYRTVTAEGTYLDDDTVVVPNRTLDGAPGGWVLTPLRLGDAHAVVVKRGFVGLDADGRVVAPPAPAGTVRVEGLVYPSQRRGRLGPTDAEGERLSELARVDLERYGRQVEPTLLPAYIQATGSEPPELEPAPGAPAVIPLGPPEPDLGPHLAYAVQWFIFSAIAIGGYPLLLRRVAQEQGRSVRAAGE